MFFFRALQSACWSFLYGSDRVHPDPSCIITQEVMAAMDSMRFRASQNECPLIASGPRMPASKSNVENAS